jgi:hypothetical protein
MELFRAVDAYKAVKTQYEVLEACRPVIEDSHHIDKEQDPDPH